MLALLAASLSMSEEQRARRAALGAQDQLTQTFKSSADLGVWADYLDSVFGIHTMRFPFSLAELSFFYEERLPKPVARTLVVRRFDYAPPRSLDGDGLGNIVRGDLFRYLHKGGIVRCMHDVCSTLETDTVCKDPSTLYTFAGLRCPKRTADELADAALQPSADDGPIESLQSSSELRLRTSAESAGSMPSSLEGEANHTLVEGTHLAIDPKGFGCWFYFARGSGVYVNLGKSRVFEDHQAAFRVCQREWQGCGNDKKDHNRQVIDEARRRGLDSLQCARADNSNHASVATYRSHIRCCNVLCTRVLCTPDDRFMRYMEGGIYKQEFVLLRVNTPDAEYNGVCLPQADAHLLRGGFGGSHDCACNSSQQAINCAIPGRRSSLPAL